MYFKCISCTIVAALVFALPTNSQNSSQEQEPILLLSPDLSNHFELLVALGEGIYGGADIGPVLGVAKALEPNAGNFSAWSAAWYDLATRTKARGEDPRLAYDPTNVQDTWFSAATYFRRADFYNHGNWSDPRINEFWVEQLAAFDKGLASLAVPAYRFQIPTHGFNIEATWYPASAESVNCTKRPTLILGNGYDGAQEDLYHTIVIPAMARGWNCITYEGPGHPAVRRFQDLGFIPDWERVVTPVVDYLLSEHADVVDEDRLVLFGYSFGGYLAARAAAFEPRLAAVVLNGGVYSLFDSFTSFLDPALLKLLNSGNRSAFDATVRGLLAGTRVPTNIRWGIEQGLWSFKINSPYDWLQAIKAYTLDGIADHIQMPVWIADAESEGFFRGQSTLVKQALGERATYQLFNDTAGYHCQVGALQEMNRFMFAWLHETLG